MLIAVTAAARPARIFAMREMALSSTRSSSHLGSDAAMVLRVASSYTPSSGNASVSPKKATGVVIISPHYVLTV